MELKRDSFISQYPPLSTLNKIELKGLLEKPNIHLYVHIPFCVRRCEFCYYKSETVGRKGVPDAYLEALKKEIRNYGASPALKLRNVRSLYIGGGTPSLLSEAQFETLVDTIRQNFTFTPDFEFCCEARPGWETTLSKLKTLKNLGVHRINLGCQSLDDAVLKASGCNHGTKEFYTVFDYARQAGIRTINVDLMTGLINQTKESFLQTISQVLPLGPENITLYKMEVYLNNRLFQKLHEGTIQLITDDEEIVLVRKGYNKIMESGYTLIDHYSFLTAGEHKHIHRNGQWELGEEMLGMGASSHSFLDSYMFQNDSDIRQYIKKIDLGESVVSRAHRVSTKELMVKRAVFGLKNLKINRGLFVKDFGMDILDVFPGQFTKLENEGFVIINADTIASTLECALFADDIARALFQPEHRTLKLAHALR